MTGNMKNQASGAIFDESDSTYYLTGPQLQDFMRFAFTTILIVAVVQGVTMITDSQAILVVVASVLTITQTVWLLRDADGSEESLQKMKKVSAASSSAEMGPATSLLTSMARRGTCLKKNV